MKDDMTAVDDQIGDSRDKQNENAIVSCLHTIDLVSNFAIQIILDYVENLQCPNAKALLSQPEVLAFKAMEVALQSVMHGGRAPDEMVQ